MLRTNFVGKHAPPFAFLNVCLRDYTLGDRAKEPLAPEVLPVPSSVPKSQCSTL